MISGFRKPNRVFHDSKMEDKAHFTLKKICAKRIADYIGNGTLHTFKLADAPLSNLIFTYLLGNQNFDHQFFGNVRKCLNVTQVEHNLDDVKWLDGKLTYFQDIESLSLMKIREWERFHTKFIGEPPEKKIAPKDGKLYSYYEVRIIHMLRLFLNSYSRKKLKSLTILPDYGSFPQKWLKKIYHHFPSLTTLNLESCMLQNDDFRDQICAHFRNLTRLDIHDCNLTSLEGISNLKKLEYLDITGIDLEEPEDMEELFELKELKTLIVATIFFMQKSNFMEFWCQSNRVLPNLEHLDCSFNMISVEQLQKLLEDHKNLKDVCLIGSFTSSRNIIQKDPRRIVKIYNTKNLVECMDAVEYYTSTYRNIPKHILDFLLKFIIDHLIESRSKTPVRDLHKCLNLMCTHREKLGFGVFPVMYFLVKNGYWRYHKVEDINFMFNILTEESWAFVSQKRNAKETEFQKMIWKLLWGEKIFHDDHYRRLCLQNKGFDLLNHSEELDPEVAVNCFNMVISNLKGFFNPIPSVSLYDGRFVQNSIKFLRNAEFSEETRENLQDFLDVIHNFYDPEWPECQREYETERDQKIIRSLWTFAPKFKGDPELIIMLFNTLGPILFRKHEKTKHLEEVFLEEATIEVLLPLIFINRTKELATFAFIKIVDMYDEKMGSNTTGGHLEEILLDMQDAVLGYVDTGKPGFYDKLSWLMTHCRSVHTERAVGQFYQHFLDLEAEKESMEISE